MKLIYAISALACIALATVSCTHKRSGAPRVLVFTKTAGFHHASIPDGVKAIQKLGAANGFAVDTTSDASRFTEDSLKQYAAVIFLNTTGEVLNNYQQADFERYIQAGGGFVGVHAAADCGYTWPWYGKLVGAYFMSHPHIQKATVHIKDRIPGMEDLPETWTRTDEWYNFRDYNKDVHLLITLDEKSYEGGKMGDFHPVVWNHEYDGGRAFYMEFGHTSESYTDPDFLKLLLAGIHYAIGDNNELNYGKAHTERVPAEDRFSKEFLGGGLEEPTELTVLPNLDILISERRGQVLFYNAATKEMSQVAKLDVYHKTNVPNVNVEMGLLGIQADPDYADNHWVYLYYSPMDKSVDRLSRFKFIDNKFDLASEQIILEVPTERDMCCHTGGSIAFDGDGNLFVSVGDNTTPFDETDTTTGKAYPINLHGFAPLDDRPGFSHFDDRRAAGNTNDLRGKILRIKVHEDGSYEVPTGNLFPKGTPKTKPEIYVMGDRNPYRISVDKHTGYLYWGEVGPDAANDSLETRGPRGYDEVNQAREAGNFGWPYFVGNNYAYHKYNYATGETGPVFDPEHLVNDSRNNTGLRDLPPAHPAYIWYPYAKSPDFPILGQGGRCAMAGPVYYTGDYPEETRLPDYYDGKLFIYDWIRNWIMAVTMDKEGNLLNIEPFMQHAEFNNISDMEVGRDGRLYLVEYGTGWFTKNDNSGLFVINYNSGNRPPVVNLEVSKTAGALPLRLHLSAAGTYDPDGDVLKYVWDFGYGIRKETTGPEIDYTYNVAGNYPVSVTVYDSRGGKSASVVKDIYAGNERPEVNIHIAGNPTFYFPGRPVNYQVSVQDKEDGASSQSAFDLSRLFIKADYLQSPDKVALPAGHEEAMAASLSGKSLMESLDCQSCHKIAEKSVGPAFKQVSEKYQDDPGAMDYLPHKIINGGSGVWGETAMPAHPGLAVADAKKIVTWVLSLGADSGKMHSLPEAGSISLRNKYKLTDDGVFYLQASYTDKGGDGLSPLTGSATVTLRNPYLHAASADQSVDFSNVKAKGMQFSVPSKDNAWLAFKDISLNGVSDIEIGYGVQEVPAKGWKVELHLDSPEGTPAGATIIGPQAAAMKPATAVMKLDAPDNKPHDLYFVFRKLDPSEASRPGVTGFRFEAE